MHIDKQLPLFSDFSYHINNELQLKKKIPLLWDQ